MSTHKNIDRICIVMFVLTLILTVAFMNGEKLGIKAIKDEDAESYSGSTYFTENDLDGDWSDNAYTTYIFLDGSGGEIDGNGAYFLNGDLVISKGGWYVISGSLEDGSIVVDAYDSSKIWIRLNGVTVNCSDDACLIVDQADKVFLTLAEGTENSFTGGSSYSDDALSDNTGGTIFSHDDLTINGSGSLNITAGYKHGIDVNDSLVITGGNITITAPQDGIHVNDSFRFINATLTLDAGDDGVHSDDEFYIESGTILVNSCYEGLEAITIDIVGGNITIYSTDDGINANGGTGETKFGAMGAGAPPNHMGNSVGKSLSVSGSDDENKTSPPPGFADGKMPSISGEMSETHDTVQAGDGSSSDVQETYIRISGGTLTIINETGQDADGLDSNGSIYIDGGDIRISLLGYGSNCAIDYGSESGGECIVTGGTILAFGGSDMAEEFSSNSTQCSVLYNIDSLAQADTTFSVLDANGDEIISYTPVCSYSSIAFSSPGMTVGETYTIAYGDSSTEITMESVAVSVGNSGGMGGMPSGGGMGENKMGSFNENTEAAGDKKSHESAAVPGRDGEAINNIASEEKTDSEGSQKISGSFVSLEELDESVWILLGISALSLFAATVFAMKYRKNGGSI